jgi:beta-N-acetylhexosaminidase
MKLLINTLVTSICVLGTAYATETLDINTLTVEEKVGQMLMVHFNGEAANEDANLLLQQAHVGGFIYYNWSNGLQNPAQVQKLSVGLQKLAKSISPHIPLLISIDQEGGVVRRLTTGFTRFPSNFAIAQTKHPKYAALSSFYTGQELKAVGINMNLAPVVDVNSNPLNPCIGVRSFSSSPEEVALLGKLSLQGYQKAGIIATLKHFPGHGDVTVDSHIGLPLVKKSLEELERTEFLPFKRLLKKTDAIMTAHILIPSLDPQNCATLSTIILEDLLRKQWGYEGVILSDSLVMQGVLDRCSSIDEAAIRAIQAGNDILILGGQALNNKGCTELKPDDIIRIHRRLVAAVNEGQIPKERLDISLQRILKLKRKYQLFKKQYPDAKDIAQFVNTPTHQQLAKEIANCNSLYTQTN